MASVLWVFVREFLPPYFTSKYTQRHIRTRTFEYYIFGKRTAVFANPGCKNFRPHKPWQIAEKTERQHHPKNWTNGGPRCSMKRWKQQQMFWLARKWVREREKDELKVHSNWKGTKRVRMNREYFCFHSIIYDVLYTAPQPNPCGKACCAILNFLSAVFFRYMCICIIFQQKCTCNVLNSAIILEKSKARFMEIKTIQTRK